MKFVKIISNSLMESFVFFRKYKKKVALLFLLELIFFVLIITSSLYFLNSIFNSFDYLRNFTADQALTESEEGLLELQNQLLFANEIVNDIYWNIGFLLIVLFILFSLFGSLSWLLSSGKKLEEFNLKYFLEFSGLVLFYFLILVLFYFVLEYLVLDFGLANQGPRLTILSLFIASYFSVLSYSLYVLKREKILNSIRESFVLGIKKIHVFILMWIIIFLVFAIGSFILEFSGFLSLYIGILLYMIIIVWGRVFILKTCGRQDSNLRRH